MQLSDAVGAMIAQRPPALSSLGVGPCKKCCGAAFAHLGVLTSFAWLSVRFCTSWRSPATAPLCHLTGLTRLHVFGYRLLGDKELAHLSGLVDSRHLDLSQERDHV